MKLLCIGRPVDDMKSIKTFGEEITYFLVPELEKYLEVELISCHDFPKEKKYDYVMSLCPPARERLLKKFASFGKPVILQEWVTNIPCINLTFGPFGNQMAPKLWGEKAIRLSHEFMLYPFTTKNYIKDETQPEKIFIDAPPIMEGERKEDWPDDTSIFYKVLEDLDLEVWQGGVSKETSPDWVKAIDKGLGKDQEYRIPWLEYIQHLNETCVFLSPTTESYGINKIHTTASNGEIIGRYERPGFRKEFNWRTFKDGEELEWQIFDAIRVYEEEHESLEKRANKIWTYEKLADYIHEVLKFLR